MDEFAVAGDEKAGRAECDDREAIDVESVKEQYDMVVAAIGSSLILWITVLPPLSELIPLAAAERPRSRAADLSYSGERSPTNNR